MIVPSRTMPLGLGMGRAAQVRPYYGVEFDGGDYLSMTDTEAAGAFDFGLNSFTMQCWVKVVSASTNTAIIQSRPGLDDWSTALFIIAATKKFAFTLDDRLAPAGPGAGYIEVLAPTAFEFDTWYHVAGVCDRVANEAYLYINGVKVATVDITGLLTMTKGDTDYLIGSNARAQFLTGEIAEVGICKGTAVTDFSDRFIPYATGNGRTSAWMFQPGSGTTVTPYIGAEDWSLGAGAAAPTWVGLYRRLTAGGPV